MDRQNTPWLQTPDTRLPPQALPIDHILKNHRYFVLEDKILSHTSDTPLASQADPLTKAHNDQGSPVKDEGNPMYPSDEPGEEMSEVSRVWRIYVDEATKFDASWTDGCNRGIDVLLVFTGLFSAVLTTFIIQSYQFLTSSVGDTTNALLTQLLAIQAQSAGIQVIPAVVGTQASLNQMLWVNGLWFAALSCSLSTALISMLAKQWLQAFISDISGTPHIRARQRQSRYNQLQRWRVLPVINALPLLLHVALLLFFSGLIVLLWSIDLPLTIVTGIIAALAYIFYCASIFLPLIYPDCPYQHPISDHLRKWLSAKPRCLDIEESAELSPEGEAITPNRTPPTMTLDDELDASALVWLFTNSTDKRVTSAALQAIAGLPRHFSATHILREADAIKLVKQAFQSCFEKDTTVGVHWHLLDADGAWLYCKAWMNLTRGISKQWPVELLDPLRKLQNLKDNSDVSATASSLLAVSQSSLDAHMAQWDLVAHLSEYVTGKTKLSHSTVCWLLDSIVESVMLLEMPIEVFEKAALSARAVPVLLRLLRHTEQFPTSHIRSATALALYSFTCGPVDLGLYQNEELRRMRYCEVMLLSLSKIAANPSQFSVTDPLLDITARELSKLASPAAHYPDHLSHSLKKIAMSSLMHLFTAGRIAVGKFSDEALADVLHLLYHIPMIPSEAQLLMVKMIVNILRRSTHSDLLTWSVRSLKKLLAGCPISVIQAFTESGGINAILRTLKVGDVGHRQLRADSWQTLCICINASITLADLQYEPPPSLSNALKKQLDAIFQSDFFDTFCSTISLRPWWFFEVSEDWIPTLTRLCRLRPHESVWRNIIRLLHDADAKTQDHQGISEALYELENILQSSQHSDHRPINEVLDKEDLGRVTMMQQRSKARPLLAGRVSEPDNLTEQFKLQNDS